MSEQAVVVTGSSSGIGAATARRLTADGFLVLGVDRTPPDDGAAVARHYEADLADPASIDALAAALLGEHPRLHGLCAVAGVPGTAPVELLARVNYLGIRHLTALLAPHTVRGGSIAVAASVAGVAWPDRVARHLELARTPSFAAGEDWIRAHPVAQADGYPYFKEALVVWAKTASTALLPDGVRVNCVSPGPVSTPILADFRASLGADRVAADIDRVGRAGDPDEIAAAFRFLMGADSAWVNGADLATDGGLAAAVTVSDRPA